MYANAHIKRGQICSLRNKVIKFYLSLAMGGPSKIELRKVVPCMPEYESERSEDRAKGGGTFGLHFALDLLYQQIRQVTKVMKI